MLLTYKQVSPLLAAHIALAVSSGEGSGEIRVKVAHNLAELRKADATALEARKAAFKEVAGESGTIDQTDPKAQQLGMRMTEIDETPVELKLWRLPFDKLQTDKISPSAMEALMPILKDVPDLGEPDA